MWFLFGEVSSSSGYLGWVRYFIVAHPEPSTLRKLLRNDSVISVKLHLTSFLAYFLLFTKNDLFTIKYILNGSIFGTS